jgi:hypothetical protein
LLLTKKRLVVVDDDAGTDHDAGTNDDTGTDDGDSNDALRITQQQVNSHLL